MWPVLFTFLRSYAPYVTLPFAGLVGFVGYNLENILSDKYTPYNSKFSFIGFQKVDCTTFVKLTQSKEFTHLILQSP